MVAQNLSLTVVKLMESNALFWCADIHEDKLPVYIEYIKKIRGLVYFSKKYKQDMFV